MYLFLVLMQWVTLGLQFSRASAADWPPFAFEAVFFSACFAAAITTLYKEQK